MTRVKSRSLLTLGVSLILITAARAEEWQPAGDGEAYRQVLAIVTASEDYTHFLREEKRLIPMPSPAYLEARWAYFKELHVTNPQVAVVTAPLKKFIDSCVAQRLVKAQDKAFADAATALGMELITDRSPMQVSPGNVKITRNVTYATYGGYACKLDVFVPAKIAMGGSPCIVFMHDGAWEVHKRAWFEGHAILAARAGFVAVNIDYRLVPGVTPVECVQDAKAAVRWVRANAAAYGINPDKIGACGASAGAHLAAVLATTSDRPELEGTGGNAGFSSKIQAAVGMATPALTGRATWPAKDQHKGLPKWYKKVSPFEFAGAGDAPMKFIHGAADTLVSPDEPKDLAAKLTAAGVPCEVEIIPAQGHVFYMDVKVSQDALAFFKQKLN